MNRLLTVLTNAFPAWVIAAAALALWRPEWCAGLSGPWITWGLAVVMLGMGLTLTVEDFKRVLTLPRAVLLGFVAQFSIMPLLGWLGGWVFALETPFAVGLILVACCPGGTASNVVTFLARGNVGLSVVMTMCSTFAALFMTPMLTSLLAGTLVQVDGWGLFVSTLKVVIAPVALGVMLNRYATGAMARVQGIAPLASVVVIALIVAGVVSSNAVAIRSSALSLLGAVTFLHAGGFVLGYSASRLLRFDKIVARTVSIETGMQNSGLGVVLARNHFADPLTAVPCAISSVLHSVVGSIAVGWWRWRSKPE